MACHINRDLDEGWNVIKDGMKKVASLLEGHSDQAIDAHQYMHLTIFNLGTKKSSGTFSELYNTYKRFVNEYIYTTVLPDLRAKQGKFMLKELERRWKIYKVLVEWMSLFFDYVDRFYTSKRNIPSIGQTGLSTFVELVYNELRINVKNTVLILIESEREGELIERSLLKNVVGIFVEAGMGNMDCYVNDFEAPMLQESETYYSRKAALWITEYSCPAYLFKVEECLQLEKDRVSNYLDASTEQKLLDKLENELLTRYKDQILQRDCGPWDLLRAHKKDDLSRMFRMFNKIYQGLDPIACTFKQFVTGEGTELVKQAEDAAANIQGRRDTSGTRDQGFIRKLFDMHDKYEHYVLECFQNNKLFQKALDEAFTKFCNEGFKEISIPELLSTFSDNVLRNGSSEKLNDDEIEIALEKVVKILYYVTDKDMFAEFYRKKLARRLLSYRSADVPNEQSMLAKLKQENGIHYTRKMECMVNDLSLSKDLQEKFVAYLNREDIHVGLEMSVTVLTSGLWPPFNTTNMDLPSELGKCINVFNQFYGDETKQRKLQWMFSLGSCIVEGKFTDKTIEMVLSPNQASLLMLFNESERLSFGDLKSQLKLENDEVIKVLHSLACSKYKVLLKEPNTQKILPTDYFEFNSGFTDNCKRIKIPLPHSDEKTKVKENVVQDRTQEIEAAVVHIMKREKELSFQRLQNECIDYLKKRSSFMPDLRAIKKGIEGAIRKDYIERDPNDRTMFRYIA
ncbi:cullin-1 [Cryptomeria japonica]|uniref:cullin-1 n=1 Tax=Cryptomeria japonica TaxID=3369 RepID=UPI0027DA70D9|nr:cullin-1 [Cryptomeria japonica]